MEVQEETLVVLLQLLELLGKDMREEQVLVHLMETPEVVEVKQALVALELQVVVVQ